MTRDEMLKKMDLTHEEHVDLMNKFEAFHASLNKKQQKVIKSSVLSLDQARKTFGPSATVHDVANLVGPKFAAMGSSCNGAHSSPPPQGSGPDE